MASDVGRDSAMMRTVMGTRLVKAMMSTPEQGAEPLLHLATTTDATAVNGGYFNRLTREEPTNPQAIDPVLARQLWDRATEMTGLPATSRH